MNDDIHQIISENWFPRYQIVDSYQRNCLAKAFNPKCNFYQWRSK